MEKFLKYCCLIVLIAVQNLEAQNVRVLEFGTDLTIPDVVISNLKKTKSVVTDIDGQALLDKFDDNEWLFFKNFLYQDFKIKKTDLDAKNNTVYLKLNVQALDQIVISATGFEQSKRDIPRTIVTANYKDVSFINPQTSADLLDNTGNVFIQKSQMGGGSPMIRGFSTKRLLISVDGVRMNNAIFRGGNLQNVISVDPLAIQNTEVILGAGSVIYGSDAIGGVMSFYSKKPSLSYQDEVLLKVNALTRFASANTEKTGHVDLNLGYKKWGFLTSATFTDFDDLRMGSYGPTEYLRPNYIIRQNGQDLLVENSNPQIQKPTAYNQVNLMQKVRFEPSVNLNFDLGVYFSTTSDYPRYDRLVRPQNNSDVLRSAEWQYGPQQWFMTNFKVTKLSSSSNLYDKIKIIAAYQNFKESRRDRDFQSPLREVREENVDALSFNLDLEKNLSTSTTLFYGLEYLYNKVGSRGKEENIDINQSVPNVTRYPNGSSWQSVAAYASLKYKPHSKFVFQSGLRYNQVIVNANFEENNRFLNLPFNDTNVNTGALTGSAGVTWTPNDVLQWKLNFSTAFRAPNIDDIGKVFDSEPGSVVVPNNDLKAEYAYGGELGLRLNFSDRVTVDLATYYTFLDNALITRNSNLNGVTEILYDGELSNIQSIQNASKAWIYGFEVGVEVLFSEFLKLRTQYNIIGGTEDNNGIEVPVRHVAPNFGRTHLIWEKNKLQLDAFLVYNNTLSYDQLAPSELSKDYLYARDDNGNPYAPSWYTLNFRSQYQLNNHFTVTAALENITDQRYRPYSSGIAAPGRNFILSVQYTL